MTINNKLVFFRTRQAFEDAKPNIADTSVVFVEEGKTIYTHGVEFNAESLKNAIDSIHSELNEYIRDYTNKIQLLSDKLHDDLED